MRNLIELISRYRIGLLFILLEGIALSMLMNFNSHHSIRLFTATNELAGGVYARVAQFTSYLNLRETNSLLMEENRQLRNLLFESQHGSSNTFEHLVDTNYQQLYEYTEANVVSLTVTHRNNYLIIDKGTRQGIKQDMGVITSNGAVGVVKEASANYATVMTLLHSESAVSTQLVTDNYFGPLTWNGRDPNLAQLADIPMHVNLTDQTELVTRGASGIFPAGVPIGKVSSWESNVATNFYEIEVDLEVDFAQIYHVYVIRNVKRNELLQHLENTLPNAE